jgi:Arylsulfotransferase (ASST)
MARTEHHPNGLIHYNPQLAFRGYTLFSTFGTKAYLMDMQGRFVHEWQHERGISNPELLPNGNLMSMAMPSPNVAGQRGLNGQSAACYELDWDGNVVWQYEDPWIHHDYQRLPNGNTLIIKWEELPKSKVKQIRGGYHADGDDPASMLGDVVIEVSPAGKVVRRWLSWHELDPKLDEICPLEHRREWTHANSIAPTPKGEWLISLRSTSTLIRVNPRSGKIRWRFADDMMRHQHDAKFTAAGTITVFDNGVHRKGIEYSRALEIDPKTRKVIWEYADNPPFTMYTLMGGCVDRLPNANTLITETAKGHFLEVTPDKKVVWEYINPFFGVNPRLGGRINMVFRAHRYSPGHPAFKHKDLDPAKFANLNRLYADGAA